MFYYLRVRSCHKTKAIFPANWFFVREQVRVSQRVARELHVRDFDSVGRAERHDRRARVDRRELRADDAPATRVTAGPGNVARAVARSPSRRRSAILRRGIHATARARHCVRASVHSPVEFVLILRDLKINECIKEI